MPLLYHSKLMQSASWRSGYDITIGAEGLGFYSRIGQIGQCCQRQVIAATFCRSCVAQGLSPATRYTLWRMTASTIDI